jgi:hypothetical protein
VAVAHKICAIRHGFAQASGLTAAFERQVIEATVPGALCPVANPCPFVSGFIGHEAPMPLETREKYFEKQFLEK